MENIVGHIGRTPETEQALAAIAKGSNLLIKGKAGIGKSAFMRHLSTQLGRTGTSLVMVPTGTVKHVLAVIGKQLHEQIGLVVPVSLLGPRMRQHAARGNLPWPELERTYNRLSVTNAGDIIIATLRKQKMLFLIESLEVPPQQADLFAQIIEVAQVVGALDDKNRRIRIDRLLWRFHSDITLKPLTVEQGEHLARTWMAKNPIRFSDKRTRRRFVRHVAQDSGGVPAAIRGMLETASREQEITPAMARSFTHAAGTRYIDMTPSLILVIVLAMAGRYMSRGLGEVEMMVMSGVATALFFGLRFFLYQMRRR